ncbi:hypothetical protein [Nonomuraea soli]|uniref:Uncharacterized protein n=1 Tax=Nonomuraea soli TaxID=1032476 RepID=A0A7W0CTV7_9ACTN|nr:hypothetical protein [Nonomuraea soli]MBA2897256.1 hypothetical protein [Nonomuraea soli]
MSRRALVTPGHYPVGSGLTRTSGPAFAPERADVILLSHDQHGPDGTEHLVGEVTGFVLSGEGLPVVDVSGDNASLEVVKRIAAAPAGARRVRHGVSGCATHTLGST